VRNITGLLTCGLVLTCWLSGIANAAEGLDAPTHKLWERHWRFFAQRCAEFEGEYICCPLYDRRYPSSSGISVRQAEAELSQKVEKRGSGMVVTKTVKMPIGEAKAMAMPIPRLAVGQYGYLASVEVDEVLGQTSMLVEDVYLIDAAKVGTEYKADRAKVRLLENSDAAKDVLEHMYSRRRALSERQKDKNHKRAELRLEGFPTRGLTKGQRFEGLRGEGLQVLIVRQEFYGSERRPRKRLVAVALDRVKWGLDEDGFIQLLAARGLDPARFVELVMEKMGETDPHTAQQDVFASLLPPPPSPPKDSDEKTDDTAGTDDDAPGDAS
jgi:hypothetical protein